MDILPVETGTYALILTLESPQTVTIGRLGNYDLSTGYYLYTGSAHGAGGLRARLGRHLRGGKRVHWHIDYLRKIAKVSAWGYLVSSSASAYECQWSQWLADIPETTVPVPGFGASDCRCGCQAHLTYFTQAHIWQGFATQMGLITGGAWLGLNSSR
jgi:Uri superfamily endonuclease